MLTLGKHHFWLLPNLTEDVGFFDSFRPLYKHDVVSKTDDSKSTEGGKKKKKQEKDGNKKHGEQGFFLCRGWGLLKISHLNCLSTAFV